MLFALRMLLLSVLFIVVSTIELLIAFFRPFNPDNNRWFGRLYHWSAIPVLGLRMHIDIEQALRFQGPCVVVANHQSNYDLFVLGCAVPPRTVTIGKRSLKWVPLFGQIYWLSANVLIQRGNAAEAKRAMLATTDTLRHKKTSIWVFAEGTRNLGRGLKPFKKGAFQMAINAGVPIIPICTSTYKRSMRLNRWHAGDIFIKALPPISTQGMSMDDMPELMAQCQAQMAACIDELDAEVSRLAR